MRYITFTLIFSFWVSLVSAQEFKGAVRDMQQQGIADVYVQNLSTEAHAHTDARGTFRIRATAGDSLLLSHLDYALKIWVVANDSAEITLEPQMVSIEPILLSLLTYKVSYFSDIDLKMQPLQSSQELLTKVPGLFIGQHAGGGKAEQIFLRGFDIDHGTDIQINVDGMPVNMVSHAHGQGYADLHFVIPETIENIDFGKGPYSARHGNFTTAGYVDMQTKKRLHESRVQFGVGQFNTRRFLGLLSLVNQPKHSAYVASEYLLSDGPFDSPQHFNRLNLFGKYHGQLDGNNSLSISASHFQSRWDASGQIPIRAIESGLIGRFGAIDDTEGGETSRSNVVVNHVKQLGAHHFVKSNFYYSRYMFDLYSNFTFFLDDPVNGDQIRQYEARDVFGGQSEWNRQVTLGQTQMQLQAGAGFRRDHSKNNGLYHTKRRLETLSTLQLGNIQETAFFGYASAKIQAGKWMIQPSLRIDHFDFSYDDMLSANYDTRAQQKSTVSPKLAINYQLNDQMQLYTQFGRGFHSNDTRVILMNEADKILPAAYGTDLGMHWKPSPRMLVNVALWQLFMEQEFVYVGDAGIVEPSGKTQRAGIELAWRYQILDWLFWRADANYTYARSIEAPAGEDYIPLAPDFTAVAGLQAQHKSGLYGSLQARYMDARPANEDGSITAEGYLVTDLKLGYRYRNIDINLNVLNLLDTQWKETQFATLSRLANEPQGVEEIHFIPGTPRFVQLNLAYFF